MDCLDSMTAAASSSFEQAHRAMTRMEVDPDASCRSLICAICCTGGVAGGADLGNFLHFSAHDVRPACEGLSEALVQQGAPDGSSTLLMMTALLYAVQHPVTLPTLTDLHRNKLTRLIDAPASRSSLV